MSGDEGTGRMMRGHNLVMDHEAMPRREMVDAKRASELIESAISSLTPEGVESIGSIKLGNKSYDSGAAEVLAEALKDMKEVEHADLSDIIAGRPEEEALNVMKIICEALSDRQLVSIDLSDNAMGEKGIDSCRYILEGNNTRLRSLKMCNDGLSSSAMERVTEILGRGDNLETLHFFNNMSGSGGAVALAEFMSFCPVLKDLRFSGTRAGLEGSLGFTSALAESPSVRNGLLVNLDLADNTFGVEGAHFLAQALRGQPNLTALNLRDGSLGAEGTLVIASSLDSCPDLSFLDLSGNECTKDAAEGLAVCIGKKPLLTTLNLEENELGSSGLKILTPSISRLEKLQYLQLNTNEIGSKSATALVKQLMRLHEIKSIQLNCNAISEDGIAQLTRMLESAGKGGVLGDMDECDEDLEEEEEEEQEEEEEGVSAHIKSVEDQAEEEEIDVLASVLSKSSI